MFSKVMSSNKQRFLLWVLILLAINLIFKTHGYSIHAWRHPLEIKEGGVLNIGPPRGIRGDDWIVNFTFWRMQERARAGTVNSLIGYGQDFSLSPFVFVKHWSSVFKPHLWGFGLNINLGMSWLWNFLSLGALLVIYFSFRVLLPNLGSSWICGFLAITFLFSNFFQFWSLVSVPSFVYAGIALLAFRGVFSNCFRHWATSSLLLVWTLGALGFVFYPPFQVPSIHLLLLGMALIAYSEFRKHPPQQFLFKLLIGVVTGLVAIAIFCLFLYEKQDVVRTMLSTVYPGRRETLGGGLSLIRIIQDSVFPFLVISDFSKLGGNICEAAGFLNFLPLLIFLNLAFRKKMPQPAGIVALVFTLYQLFIFGWWIFGIPSWLAKITGLNMVPSVRASGVLGVTNMVLLGTWFYSNQNDSLLNSVQRSWIKRGWLLFLVLIWIAIFCLSADFRGVPWPQKLASFILVTLVFFLGKKIIEGKLASFAKGFAALSVLLTFFFNPIVFGGGDSLMEAS
ncbi:hypothetical protein EBT16_10530, partial [bacterium]|nr:hypothetical protein [bacterium]